jgi:hypothetical protein
VQFSSARNRHTTEVNQQLNANITTLDKKKTNKQTTSNQRSSEYASHEFCDLAADLRRSERVAGRIAAASCAVEQIIGRSSFVVVVVALSASLTKIDSICILDNSARRRHRTCTAPIQTHYVTNKTPTSLLRHKRGDTAHRCGGTRASGAARRRRSAAVVSTSRWWSYSVGYKRQQRERERGRNSERGVNRTRIQKIETTTTTTTNHNRHLPRASAVGTANTGQSSRSSVSDTPIVSLLSCGAERVRT